MGLLTRGACAEDIAPHLDFAHEFIADMDRSGDYLFAVESEATKQLYILKLEKDSPGRVLDRHPPMFRLGTYRLETPEDKALGDPAKRISGSLVCSLVGNVVLGAPLKRVTVVGDRAFIASSPAYRVQGDPDPTDSDEVQPPMLFEVDVSDKSHPRIAGRFPVPFDAVSDMAASTDALIVAGRDKILVYEPDRLEKPKGEFAVLRPKGLFPHDKKLFVGCQEGLKVYALDGGQTKAIGSYACGPAGAVFVSEGRAYVCLEGRGRGMEIVDVSDPAKATRLGRIGPNQDNPYVGLSEPLDVEVRDALACVADYCFGLKVFDVSDPAQPRYVGGHFRFSRWWKVVSFRVCTDAAAAYVGMRAALEVVRLH